MVGEYVRRQEVAGHGIASDESGEVAVDFLRDRQPPISWNVTVFQDDVRCMVGGELDKC